MASMTALLKRFKLGDIEAAQDIVTLAKRGNERVEFSLCGKYHGPTGSQPLRRNTDRAILILSCLSEIVAGGNGSPIRVSVSVGSFSLRFNNGGCGYNVAEKGNRTAVVNPEACAAWAKDARAQLERAAAQRITQRHAYEDNMRALNKAAKLARNLNSYGPKNHIRLTYTRDGEKSELFYFPSEQERAMTCARYWAHIVGRDNVTLRRVKGKVSL